MGVGPSVRLFFFVHNRCSKVTFDTHCSCARLFAHVSFWESEKLPPIKGQVINQVNTVMCGDILILLLYSLHETPKTLCSGLTLNIGVNIRWSMAKGSISSPSASFVGRQEVQSENDPRHRVLIIKMLLRPSFLEAIVNPPP